MTDKEREENYWQSFSETACLPDISGELQSEEDIGRALNLLSRPYNQLTKILFAEELAKLGKLPQDKEPLVQEALEWVRRMIFSRKRDYPRKKEMSQALEVFCKNAISSAMKHKDSRQLAWAWTDAAHKVFKGLPGSSSCIPDLIDELRALSKDGNWQKMQADGRVYHLVLFWIVKLMAKCSQPAMLATFVKVLKFDGLGNMPPECYERKKKDPPPEVGPKCYPALAEDIAKEVYRVFKSESRKRAEERFLDRNCLEWAKDYLKSVHKRFPDDEWAEFRIGKMFVWLGEREDACEWIMPIARVKQSEFWIWVLLGDVHPEKKKECLARGLLCKADEKYTGALKREAEHLGLDRLAKEELRRLAQNAEALLLGGLPSIKGVLVANFKNSEGKFRVRFQGEGIGELPGISPAKVNLPHGLPDGAPVWLYCDVTNPKTLVGVKMRDDGEPWDVCPCDTATYYAESRKGKLLLASADWEYGCERDLSPVFEAAEFGESFIVRYTERLVDGEKRRSVRYACETQTPSGRIVSYEGPVRFANGGGNAAFVQDVYINPAMTDRLVSVGCEEGTIVAGVAIVLPQKLSKDKYGNLRLRKRKKAMTAEVLHGESLERYKHEH